MRRTILCAAACLVPFVAGVGFDAPPVTSAQTEVTSSAAGDAMLTLPAGRAEGIAAGDGGLWFVSSERRELTRFDAQTRRTVSSFSLEIEHPRGLCWDGTQLWCADGRSHRLCALDPATGRLLSVIDVPVQVSKELATLEGVAWDGTHLWTAYSAGWSSRILRIDRQTGQVVESLLARCLPRGLAWDGQRLWVASYNGGRNPGRILARVVRDDSGKLASVKSFLCKTAKCEPVALGFDGTHLLVCDRTDDSVQRVLVPSLP